MTIQILDKEITLKNSFRTYIIYENITGKSFQNAASLSDILCFMYATVLASAKTTDITFDEFMDYIDENPAIVTEFSQWLLKSNEVIAEASNDNLDVEEPTKKKTKKKKS